ncbi:protein kinase, partial [Streptomyces durocortorensis]|uniref:protein kinase n=1 Tax=Streptomyces durocortorensis TaxID=2811104 RepID=UPI0027DAC111
MDDYAGRVLADRYRLPLPPSDGYELAETRAFDTYSGQEVLVRQVPLPEIVDAEVLDGDGRAPMSGRTAGRAVRRSTDPAVRRAIEAAQAAAQVPDHPRLDQVFDVFAEAGSLWIVSELVAARSLAALLAERPLTPYRAAEIGSDVLTALRVLHAHGWTHRNITVRTVLVCDDGRVMLTGLAAGAAEEALCGYAPGPQPDADPVAAPATYGIPTAEPAPPRELDAASRQLPPARGDETYEAVESYQGGESFQGYEGGESYPSYGGGESLQGYGAGESPRGYGAVESDEAVEEGGYAQGRAGHGSGDGGVEWREGRDGRSDRDRWSDADGWPDREDRSGRDDRSDGDGWSGRDGRSDRDRDGRSGRELSVPPLPQGYAPRREDDRDAARDDDRHDDRYGLQPGREDDPVPAQRAEGQEIVPRPAAPAVPYTA